MRWVAAAAVVLAMPGVILAWAVAPILRAHTDATLILLTLTIAGGVFVGWSLADAIGDGLAAWGAARGIASGRDGAGAARDVIDLDARRADVELVRARSRQLEHGMQAPLPPPTPILPMAVDDSMTWRVE